MRRVREDGGDHHGRPKKRNRMRSGRSSRWKSLGVGRPPNGRHDRPDRQRRSAPVNRTHDLAGGCRYKPCADINHHAYTAIDLAVRHQQRTGDRVLQRTAGAAEPARTRKLTGDPQPGQQPTAARYVLVRAGRVGERGHGVLAVLVAVANRRTPEVSWPRTSSTCSSSRCRWSITVLPLLGARMLVTITQDDTLRHEAAVR